MCLKPLVFYIFRTYHVLIYMRNKHKVEKKDITWGKLRIFREDTL